MAPRIRAERDAAAGAKSRAKANADAHFTNGKGRNAKTAEEKIDPPAGQALKQTVLELKLPDRRDYASHLKSIASCKEKVATATGLLRNAKKRAREAGIDPKEIDEAIFWKEKSPEDFNRWLGGILRACEVNGIQVPQMTFFDESGLSPTDKAFQDGHRAGLAGESFAANPHADVNSEVGRRWEDGRQRGQAELAGKSFGVGKPSGDDTAGKPETETLFPEDEAALAERGEGEGAEASQPEAVEAGESALVEA